MLGKTRESKWDSSVELGIVFAARTANAGLRQVPSHMIQVL